MQRTHGCINLTCIYCTTKKRIYDHNSKRNDPDLRENTERMLHGNQQQKASESLLRERSVLARVELRRLLAEIARSQESTTRPITIGRASRWVASEIDVYLQARIAPSRAKNAAQANQHQRRLNNRKESYGSTAERQTICPPH
jgi:predicted DNA-binding transcriptional regulator AlpA